MSVQALQRRLAKLEASRAVKARALDLPKILFPEQLAFVASQKRLRTAVCSRRAGKTVGIAAALLDTCAKKPKSVNVYITKTRVSAKRIVWGTLKEYNTEYALGGEVSESDLSIRFPNGSFIYLAGANTKDEIEKLRGMPIGLAVIDEAQMLPAYIEQLIDEVIAPALMDYAGSLLLIGTPSPVPTGYFHACATSAGWEHHSWTAFQNPWLERKSGHTQKWLLEEEMKRRGITSEDDPVVQREWYGRWVLDTQSLVFRYESGRNAFDALPPVKEQWEHVLGVDLGFDDSDAIAVLAFSPSSPYAYLVDEVVTAKQTITQLTNQLTAMVAKYEPLSIVMDAGGLGKKISAEMAARTSLPLKAAEKSRKFEYIELLNDALRSGRMFIKRGSKFATDALLVEWDRDKSTSDKRVVSDRFHSDIADAVLYAFRESLHWLHEPASPTIEAGSAEHARMIEDEMAEKVLRQVQQRLDEQREQEEWAQ